MRRLLALLAVAVLAALALSSSGAARTAALSRCHTANLGLDLGRGDGAAGTVFYPVTLRNESLRTCTVRGYPGVSFLGRRFRQVGRAAQRVAGPVRTVVLAPGASATSRLSTSDVACRRPGVGFYLKVFPPNEFGALVRRARVGVCDLRVGPLHAGTRP
jgi:Domain of unknown function (DUF4232)